MLETAHFQTCSKCSLNKSQDCFYKGRGKICKSCRRSQDKAWRAEPAAREARRAAWRKYYAANPAKRLAAARFRNTGWTSEEFEAAWEGQGGVCAICFLKLTRTAGRSSSACADHCHKPIRKRGILCNVCNKALGGFRDNPDFLRSAAIYCEEDHER